MLQKLAFPRTFSHSAVQYAGMPPCIITMCNDETLLRYPLSGQMETSLLLLSLLLLDELQAIPVYKD
jgi:hypothetical protein